MNWQDNLEDRKVSLLGNAFGASLLAFAGLSINSALLKFGAGEAFLSPFVLVLVLGLCGLFGRLSRMTVNYIIFVAFMVSYIGLASLNSLLTSEIVSGDVGRLEVSAYQSTILFVSAIFFWLRNANEDDHARYLVLFKYILLISCVLVIASNVLKPYEVVAIHSYGNFEEADRASGFFGNPNEAAMAALYCIVLIMCFPACIPIWQIVECAIAITALMMTFSKTGILTLCLLFVIHISTIRSAVFALFVLLMVTVAAMLLWEVVEQNMLSLSQNQHARLLDVLNLASGDINSRSTTGRNFLFEIGALKAIEALPWGVGIGQFHSLEGGVRSYTGRWLGIHNTYLMLIGESGIFPFILFIVFWIAVFVRGSSSRHRKVLYGFSIILLADMMTSHHVLMMRLPNVAIAIVIALAGRANQIAPVRSSA